MQDGTWSQEFSELARALLATIARFWNEQVIPLALTLGVFLVVALPLLIVIAVLWYLDSTGWRPESGFYKIGLLTEGPAAALAVFAGSFARVRGMPGFCTQGVDITLTTATEARRAAKGAALAPGATSAASRSRFCSFDVPL